MKIKFLLPLLCVLVLSAISCGGLGGRNHSSTGPNAQGIHGVTIDSGGNPLESVLIDVMDSGGLRVATGLTDSRGIYSISIQNGVDYKITYSKDGYQSVVYNNISVSGVVNLENVHMLANAQLGNGNISGLISNAVDGKGVSGVAVSLREGIGTVSGNTVATAITDLTGNFLFSALLAGNYTAELSKSGYITTYYTVCCVGATDAANQNYTISPLISSNEFRIVLTWGQFPDDLDAHLTGPKVDGDSSTSGDAENGRFHIYFSTEKYSYGGIEYANLDTDDTESYGPETITIKQQISGLYRYSVHDYTNSEASFSEALAKSQAQVKVYNGSNLVATFNVPSSSDGTLWQVFELNGSTIIPLNQMKYVTTASTFSSSNSSSISVNEISLIKKYPKTIKHD